LPNSINYPTKGQTINTTSWCNSHCCENLQLTLKPTNLLPFNLMGWAEKCPSFSWKWTQFRVGCRLAKSNS